MARAHCVVVVAMMLGACSPYYTFLPKSLTYNMEEVRRPLASMPDPIAIASSELPSIIASTEVSNVAVGSPRMGKYGWGFCLTATVGTNSAATNTVLWVTVYNPGIYGRRQAEPGDQCAFDRYTAITPGRRS